MGPTKIGALLVLANAILFFATMYRIYRLLQQRYPSLYAELGSPTPILWNHWYWQWKFAIFLFDRRYRDLDDPDLTKVCDRAYWLMHLLIATIGGTITASLVAVGFGEN